MDLKGSQFPTTLCSFLGFHLLWSSHLPYDVTTTVGLHHVGIFCLFVLFCFVFCLLFFLGLRQWHMEIPQLGVESVL